MLLAGHDAGASDQDWLAALLIVFEALHRLPSAGGLGGSDIGGMQLPADADWPALLIIVMAQGRYRLRGVGGEPGYGGNLPFPIPAIAQVGVAAAGAAGTDRFDQPVLAGNDAVAVGGALAQAVGEHGDAGLAVVQRDPADVAGMGAENGAAVAAVGPGDEALPVGCRFGAVLLGSVAGGGLTFARHADAGLFLMAPSL